MQIISVCTKNVIKCFITFFSLMSLCFCNYIVSAFDNAPVVVAGATGYIGRQVVKELVLRNIPTISLVRSNNNNISPKTRECLLGSEIVECNVLDEDETNGVYDYYQPSTTICCLASRSGVKADSWAVDYGGGKNLLQAKLRLAKKALNSSQILEHKKSELRRNHHYVLLSAYCCGKPLLQYQYAKLRLEEEVRRNTPHVSHSIIRPTAFFKSLDGQIESAKKGLPLLYFGSGNTAANAICAEDLAQYIVDCALKPHEIDMMNAVRDVGGPDVPPIPKKEQLNLIYDSLGVPLSKRRILSLPVGLIDTVIASSVLLEKVAMKFQASELQQRCEDAAEIARIVKYYATEPMVAIGSNEVHGKTKLSDHFQRIAAMGGELEEIDKMTTTTGVFEVFAKNEYARQDDS